MPKGSQLKTLPHRSLREELVEDIRRIKFPRKDVIVRLTNFILIDIRLIFIIVSVYVSIGTAITATANNEAADDANGNGTFDITSRPEHSNLQISDVSNAVLWDCREKSITKQYYKVLYGLLFTSFVLILLVFIVTRMSVLFGNMHRGLSHLHKALWNIQLLKYVRKKLKRTEIDHKHLLERFVAEWQYKEHINDSDTIYGHTDHEFRHFALLLLCPFFEAFILTIALPFMLTTYDINPIGCLVGPDEDAIEYNNVTGKVQLNFTEGVLAYQKAALTISIVLMVPIAFLAIMLPIQYNRTTKEITKDIDISTKTFTKTQ